MHVGPDRDRLRFADQVEPAAKRLVSYMVAGAPQSDRERDARARDNRLYQV
jgi:hypothetical protein